MDQNQTREPGLSDAQSDGSSSTHPAAEHAGRNEYSNYETRHSGLGIASFIIGILSWIAGFMTIAMVSGDIFDFYNQYIEIGPEAPEQQLLELVEQYPMLVTGSLLGLLAGFLMIIGAILGIVSLFQQHRKKLFPILGTCFNAGPLAILIIFFVLGSYAA